MDELSLFTAAIAIENPADRNAYLDQHCAGNPQLRERLTKLLAEHYHSQPAIDSLHDQNKDEQRHPTADFPGKDTHTGTIISGKYRLKERIGEGGMGSVWLADQTEPIKRRVALKLIKPGMDSKQVLIRFEAERQALALMDHPNIAKVLDGGLHEGRPYFVMELVKGTPITDFCDTRKLTPKERLELFVPVCHAIQHAHQKGIIHRDIKPSNVLIALYDDKPVPKVIDFGVAKATGGNLAEATIDTGFGGPVGTPQYMSPEQATFNNLDIDTRTDVYALGVLLYELLTGSTPFTKKELSEKGLLEILRVVREEEPPRPSTKLSTADALPRIAATRSTEPQKLTGLLRNELDWIIMKALEKDRSRRYETANGFASDITRYLTGEPVLAHPPSRLYQLKKFVRRNKGPMIAASLVAFALLAGVIGTSIGLLEARRQATIACAEADQKELARQAEADERKQAQAKEAEANAVVSFFQEQVFAAGRPKNQNGGLGSDVKLKDAIAASLPKLGLSFTSQPLVEARLRHTLGITFFYMGQVAKAVEQQEQARALCFRHLGPEHINTLKSMMNLASSYAALNRHAEAIKLSEETLTIQKRVLPPDHPDTLDSMMNLASSYAALNRTAEAVKLSEETLAIQKRVLSPDHPNTLKNMMNLAVMYSAMNRHAEAIKLSEETLTIQKRVLPPDHPDTLMSMINLASSYAALNRTAEAVKLSEETLAIQKRVLSPDHPNTLKNMMNLAVMYKAMNRHAMAFKLLEETLTTQKRVLTPDHPDTLMSMINLASTYAALNRHTEALKLNEETVAIQKRVLPPEHPDTLWSMMNLANSYYFLNRHAEALKLNEETVAIQKRVLPPNHPDILWTMWGLVRSLIAMDRGSEAIPLIDECVANSTGLAVNPRLIYKFVILRMLHFQKMGDPTGCRTTAAMWEKLNRSDAGSWYAAACFRGITATVQTNAKDPNAARLAKDDADKAMDWLHKAVAAGYNNAVQVKHDTDLEILRPREDFKKLLSDLAAKAPSNKAEATK